MKQFKTCLKCSYIVFLNWTITLSIGWFVAYLVVADDEFGRQIPFAFLERIKDDFKRRYQGGGKTENLDTVHALNKEFGYEDPFDVAYNLDMEYGYAETFRMHLST